MLSTQAFIGDNRNININFITLQINNNNSFEHSKLIKVKKLLSFKLCRYVQKTHKGMCIKSNMYSRKKNMHEAIRIRSANAPGAFYFSRALIAPGLHVQPKFQMQSLTCTKKKALRLTCSCNYSTQK